MNGPLVSVVIPVFRNRATLDLLFDELRSVFQEAGLSFEIVFVNDACPEGSLEIAERLASQDARVHVVALSTNMGQHRAVLEGIRKAEGCIVVIMDADLQDPPDAIPALVNKLQTEEYSAVFAGRRGRYESGGRLATSKIFKFALHLVTGVPRDAGLFVAMNRAMVERILAFHAEKPFVVAMIGCSGLPVTSIPVQRRPRPTGRSAYGPRARLAIALQALWWSAKTRMQIQRRKHDDPELSNAARSRPS